MPRHAQPLTKRVLDAMRERAEADPGAPDPNDKHGRRTGGLTESKADASSPGLVASIRNGRIRFSFRYRATDGSGRRVVQIGDYGDELTLVQARAAASTLRGELAGGVDPRGAREEARRDAATIKDVVDGYLADLDERAASGVARRGKVGGAKAARGLLERNVLPVLGSVRARDLTIDRVRQLHRRVTSAGHAPTANRVLTALQAALAWGERAGLVPVGANVARLVERNREEGRRRALTPAELERLGAAIRAAEAAGAIHPSAALAVRVLALTGARRAEALGLHWRDLDLDRGLAHLADTKTGRQTRVLGAAAVALLRAAKPKGASADAFVCGGAKPGAGFIGIDKVRLKLWKAAKIVATPEGRADLHSLRHSFASIGAHVQSGRFVGAVAPLLGHGAQASGITERYIHSNPDALRPAADAISGEMARLLGLGETGRLVAFPGAKGKR